MVQSLVFIFLLAYIIVMGYVLHEGIQEGRVVGFEKNERVGLVEALTRVVGAKGEGGMFATLKEKRRVFGEVRMRGKWFCKTKLGGGMSSVRVEGRGFGQGRAQASTPSQDEEAGSLRSEAVGAFPAVAGQDSPMPSAPPAQVVGPAPSKSSLGVQMNSQGIHVAPKTISIRVRGPDEDEEAAAGGCEKEGGEKASWLRTHFFDKIGPVFQEYVDDRFVSKKQSAHIILHGTTGLLTCAARRCYLAVLWDLIKKLLTGLFLGTVKETVANGTLVMLIYFVDFVFVGFLQPYVVSVSPHTPGMNRNCTDRSATTLTCSIASQDKWQTMVQAYTNFTRVVSLICVLAFLDGTLSPVGLTDGLFSHSIHHAHSMIERVRDAKTTSIA